MVFFSCIGISYNIYFDYVVGRLIIVLCINPTPPCRFNFKLFIEFWRRSKRFYSTFGGCGSDGREAVDKWDFLVRHHMFSRTCSQTLCVLFCRVFFIAPPPDKVKWLLSRQLGTVRRRFSSFPACVITLVIPLLLLGEVVVYVRGQGLIDVGNDHGIWTLDETISSIFSRSVKCEHQGAIFYVMRYGIFVVSHLLFLNVALRRRRRRRSPDASIFVAVASLLATGYSLSFF